MSDVLTATPAAQYSADCREDSTTELVAQFIGCLLPPPEAKRALRGIYTPALHEKLIEQFAKIRRNHFAPSRDPGVLPKWRLKRVERFISARIHDASSLRDMADAAQLSPMHFAAQFRLATGMTPRQYLQRRRVLLAQDLLSDPARSIVDVALSVGFQSQSYFTTVFKRQIGVPPRRWQDLQWEGGLDG